MKPLPIEPPLARSGDEAGAPAEELSVPEVGSPLASGAPPIDRERLTEALWQYVAEHGWLEIGAMERAFMPGRFEEVAGAIADIYEGLDR